MAETTIEWTATEMPDGTRLPGFSFNPWVGCTEVSDACKYCYARDFMTKKPRWAKTWSGERLKTSDSNWHKPVLWNREAERTGIRRKVFCASLADVFDNQVLREWRDGLWALIEDTPHLDWLLLTKRPQNIRKMLPAPGDQRVWGDGWPNVWLGTTVENQEEADRRIPHLLAVPAKVRFLSCEPLLGPVDLRSVSLGERHQIDALTGGQKRQSRRGEIEQILAEDALPTLDPRFKFGIGIDWVIGGGESGPHARPSYPDWFRSLRDQCAAADVPYFFKQWGAWTPGENVSQTNGTVPIASWFNERWIFETENLARHDGHIDDEPDLYRVGKKLAGALLDGISHKAMPA